MKVECPNCGKKYVPDLAKRLDFGTKYIQWKIERELVQKIWPDSTTIQREQLITGICSDNCWDKFLAPRSF